MILTQSGRGLQTTRNHINRDIRGGVTIMVNNNYERFYKICERFSREKRFRVYSVNIDTMKSQGTLFTADLNGNIIAGVLAFVDFENIRGLIEGSTCFVADEKRESLVSYTHTDFFFGR